MCVCIYLFMYLFVSRLLAKLKTIQTWNLVHIQPLTLSRNVWPLASKNCRVTWILCISPRLSCSPLILATEFLGEIKPCQIKQMSKIWFAHLLSVFICWFYRDVFSLITLVGFIWVVLYAWLFALFIWLLTSWVVYLSVVSLFSLTFIVLGLT